MTRIAIAGAGIAGRLFAWRLARLGHAVEVFDPAADGAAPGHAESHEAAAFTAAGMLAPLAELEAAPPEIAALGWRSLALWPGIVDVLALPADAPPLFTRRGSLLLAHPRDAGAAQRVLARIAAARDAGAGEPGPQSLDDDALQALEPSLARGLRGWLLPGEGQVDTTRLLPALCEQAPGARWHWGTRVEAVEPGRLRFADGTTCRVDVAIDTRGLGARAATALRGVRGELLWLHAPGVALHRPLRAVHPRHRVYLVPRAGDHVIVGATEIDAEDRSPVSVRSAVELLSAAHALVPELAEARIVRLATHLRPATPDLRPHVHVEDGLVRVNGLYRHGFLLAPALVDDALRYAGLAAPASASTRELHHV